jgi:anthranilate/para-aminobenzoate synthase component II
VNKDSLPDCLKVTAWSTDENGENHEIMALAHKTLPIASVQFHPESVLTEQGMSLLKNFLTHFK